MEPPVAAAAEAEERNWADLPDDALSLIFRMVGVVDILMGAQFVCRSWRKLSLEPHLWRCVDLAGRADLAFDLDMESMARAAVDRSNGMLEAYSAEKFGSDELMRYIADRTSLLKCLHLISCYDISDEGLEEIARNSPLLEELEISLCCFSGDVFRFVGQACPRLKRFRLNAQWYHVPVEFEEDNYKDEDNTEASAIANSMKELRHLQLFGNRLTNEGLHAILDNCSQLESLDIRYCFNVNMDETLRTKCARIRDLRLPTDSTADYEFIAEIGDGSFDDGYLSENTEIEMMYNDMYLYNSDFSNDDDDDYLDY